MPVIIVPRLLCYFRAALILAAFGPPVSIGGCAAYPVGYSDLGYGWPYSPAYAYAPGFGFGYSDTGVFGMGFDRDDHLHHFDHDRHFDHRSDAHHHFHGQTMMGQAGHPGSFHEPPGEFHGPAPHPGFNGAARAGGFHSPMASPPSPHPGGAHGFNH